MPFSLSRRFGQVAGDLGPAAKDGTPSLIRARKDDDYHVRKSGARALGELGTMATDLIPALIEALHDPDINIVKAAEWALERVGVKAPAETVPPLLEIVLSDGNEWVQYRATDALCLIGSAATSALINALADARSEVCRRAAETLGKMQSDARDAVPALTKVP